MDEKYLSQNIIKAALQSIPKNRIVRKELYYRKDILLGSNRSKVFFPLSISNVLPIFSTKDTAGAFLAQIKKIIFDRLFSTDIF